MWFRTPSSAPRLYAASLVDFSPIAVTSRAGLLNPPNHRMRTRMSGGVGGGEPRSLPLYRFNAVNVRLPVVKFPVMCS
jgi:hypothetical protein